ncbi:uncharacterized protein LOC131692424 [Topomyia yanbarensis]|uniref:uncharacterized protein LOC131692424 n=1 Tax=Topomyia yanbarensis TaxID=2498891 RepID=UPI00273C96C4|nr:uncharacterized protein LOC131692424 [Topomyia yanbarensis]
MLHSTSKRHNTSIVLALSIMAILNSLFDPATAQGQRFCGKFLVSTLSMLCEEFPTLPPPDYNKRNSRNIFEAPNFDAAWTYIVDGLAMNRIDKIEQLKRIIFTNYLINVVKSEAIPLRFQMAKRGIIEECCLRPCTENQLRTFCSKY